MNSINNEMEYLNMLNETSKLIAQNKKETIMNSINVYKETTKLTNEVEFWKWMGANYPKDLANTQMIQKAAIEKSRWLNTQLQGKGYEWDYMNLQKSKPLKLLSKFDAGDCPTQPGIDITETSVLDGKVLQTYQNKAYLSSNNPNLSNTPKDAIVVTNQEKVAYSQKQGYETEGYLDNKSIESIRDSRFDKALKGEVSTNYNVKNIAATSVKAGVIGAAIGMTVESLSSYKDWKNGNLTDEEYLKNILSAGADVGVTAGATTAIMIPVKAVIVSAGVSSLIAIPITFVLSSAVNNIVAPIFGRGKYKQILQEAKYYDCLDTMYEEFIYTCEMSSKHFMVYINEINSQSKQYELLKQRSKQLDKSLEEIYKKI